ncbi:MAG: hypothetical protein NTY01_25095 [Verrucomicrobia bacterium]|nr:hypothetical protein [Verrucomicrobiota bacterium]
MNNILKSRLLLIGLLAVAVGIAITTLLIAWSSVVLVIVTIAVIGIAATSCHSWRSVRKLARQNISAELKERHENNGQLARELLYASVVFLIGFCFCAILGKQFLSSSIVEHHEFDKAKLEWFLALGWVIGLIGAVWAILAKNAADRAFHEAQFAAIRSQKAYMAVSTKPVEFSDLVAHDGVLQRLLKSAQSGMHLMLGVPAVGFLSRGDNDSFPLQKDATNIATTILDKAETLINAGKPVQVVFFDMALCLQLAARE